MEYDGLALRAECAGSPTLPKRCLIRSKETVPRIADNYERLTKHIERRAIPPL